MRCTIAYRLPGEVTARLTDGMRSARRLYLFVLSHARGHCSFRRIWTVLALLRDGNC
jgi:hypothetical protein